MSIFYKVYFGGHIIIASNQTLPQLLSKRDQTTLEAVVSRTTLYYHKGEVDESQRFSCKSICRLFYRICEYMPGHVNISSDVSPHTSPVGYPQPREQDWHG